MYEFKYNVFDFLDKFQKELVKKIFVITNDDSFELYYVEAGVMFSAKVTFEEIYSFMMEEHGVEQEDAVNVFKTIYFTDITEPVSVTKDNSSNPSDENGSPEEPENKKTINIDIKIAEKLNKCDFIFV